MDFSYILYSNYSYSKRQKIKTHFSRARALVSTWKQGLATLWKLGLVSRQGRKQRALEEIRLPRRGSCLAMGDDLGGLSGGRITLLSQQTKVVGAYNVVVSSLDVEREAK